MKKILNKIFGKININKPDPLKEEKKNEEIIEKIVDDHKGVYNWPDEDLKLIEKLVNPLVLYDKEDTERPPLFCEGKLSCFFDINRDKKKKFCNW